MRIGIFGRNIDETNLSVWQQFFQMLKETETAYIVEAELHDRLAAYHLVEQAPVFSDGNELMSFGPQVLLSLGGDGTLLDTLCYTRHSTLPVMGINLGRLGFLSSVHREDIAEALSALRNGHYRIEKRSVLELKSGHELFGNDPYALNDFTLHKRDTASMITIQAFLNGEYFNTYWADGLIVATPTGSTAYSLSCGGPVIFPDCGVFILTPVAPHNLGIRPLVVSENSVISFRVQGRGSNHLISLDSRSEIIEYNQEIAIQRAPFFFSLIKLNRQNFIDTLREKLKWGIDPRNS